MTISGGYETVAENDRWTVEVNGTDYTNNLDLMEFKERINVPIRWNAVFLGIDPNTNTDFSSRNVVRLKYRGDKAFKGVITEIDPKSGEPRISLKGMGMSFQLDRPNYTKNWNNESVQNIVSELVTSNDASKLSTVDSTNDGSSLPSSVDFRMDDESVLSGLNRLIANDHDGEWWVDEDSNGNDVFNASTQRGGGASVKTYDESNTENIDENTNSIDGDYDGVVVKGYGDGDDQIKSTAGSTSDGDEVLTVVDKTILTDSQAADRASTLNNEKSVSWSEVTVNLADPYEVRQLGENVDIVSEDAGIETETQYRIVQRKYVVDFQSGVRAELVCNDKPRNFYTELRQSEDETRGQTGYMQGNRNTINESNQDLADQSNPLELNFFIPQRFTELVSGGDGTAQVRLDYIVDNYRKSFNATNSNVTDGTTQYVKTSVSDWGDIDSVNTLPRSKGTTNETLGDFIETEVENLRSAEHASFGFGEADVHKEQGTAGVQTDSNGNGTETVSFNRPFTGDGPEPVIQLTPENSYTPEHRINNIGTDGNGDYDSFQIGVVNSPDTDAFVTMHWTAQAQEIYDSVAFDVQVPNTPSQANSQQGSVAFGGIVASLIYRNNSGASIELNYDVSDSGGTSYLSGSTTLAQGEAAIINRFSENVSDGDDLTISFTPTSSDQVKTAQGSAFRTKFGYIIQTISERTYRTPNSAGSVDNVQAYLKDTQGNDISNDNGAQDSQSLPTDDSVNLNALDADDVILSTQNTTADEVTIKANGNTVTTDTFSSVPQSNEDIEIPLSDLNVPGQNTIQIVPNNSSDSNDSGTALVKGNVIVDHKLEGDRN